VSYSAMRGYSVVAGDGPMQVLLGPDDPLGRIEHLDRFAPAIGSRGGRIRYVIADEPGRVVVKYNDSA